MKKLLSIIVLFFSTSATAHDIVLRDQGKAILGVSYPSEWKQTVGKSHVVATSEDGTAWSVISALDDIEDKKSGTAKIRQGLEDYLEEIKYDELSETESGSLVLSGTGKGKKSGVDVVFTSAVFESGPGRFAGIVFIVDADIEKYYEKTVLAICQSVLIEADFGDENPEDESDSEPKAK